MRERITIQVNVTVRPRLEAIVANHSSPRKDVWRADCAADYGWPRHERDYAARRYQQSDGVVLAGAV
jgi:hypothetical protein